MRIGQKILYKDKIAGILKGTIIHKASNDNVLVKIDDEFYGEFQKLVPNKNVYIVSN